MTVIGFNFTAIEARRSGTPSGKIGINNNVSIESVEESKLKIGDKQKIMSITFKFSSVYEPEVGKVSIEGNLVFQEEAKKIDEYLKEWDKEKKLPKVAMTEILNSILARCNVQSLIMSKELNLPSPIPLPKVGGDSPQTSKPKKK